MCNDLRPQQLLAVELLAMGTPLNQVAAKLDISTMTLSRWRKQPEFAAKLSTFNQSGLEELASKVNALGLTAVEVLQEALCDMTLPASQRIKAALGVLNAMAAINGTLNKGLQHKTADFDPNARWSGGFTYARDGGPARECEHRSLGNVL